MSQKVFPHNIDECTLNSVNAEKTNESCRPFISFIQSGLVLLASATNVCDRTDIGPNDVQHNCTQLTLADPLLLALPPISGELEPNRTHHISYDGQPLHSLHPLPATTAVITFSCRRCNLSELADAAFAAIGHIRLLDLGDNVLTSSALRSAVWNGANILDLVLSGNQIDALPADDVGLIGISGLQRLDVSRNRLVNLAALLVTVPLDLQVLNVSGNALLLDADMNSTSVSMPRLLELDLRNNPFSDVPPIVAALNSTLRALTIGGGGLQRIRIDGGVRALIALHTLNILGDGDDDVSAGAETPLHIEADALDGLAELQVLHIHGNRGLRTLNVTGLLAANATLHTIDLHDNGLTTVQLNWTAATGAETVVAFGALRTMRLAGNPWHCDCALYGALTHMMRPQAANETAQRFDSEYNARCRTPHSVATDFLVDLLVDAKRAGCAIRNVHKAGRVELPYEPPAFLRPRQILLSVLSVVIVVLLGIGIGATIVIVQRRLRANSSSTEGGVLRDSPVQYTTVRNSTIVPAARQSVRLSWPAQLQQMELEQRQRERDQQVGVSERPLRPLRPGAQPGVMESFGG